MTQLSLIADRRTRAVNLRDETPDVYAGRPRAGARPEETPIGVSGWLGNPYDVRRFGDAALEMFRVYFEQRLRTDLAYRKAVLALRGKSLGCFCKPAKCHADIIAAWVESAAAPAAGE